MIEKFKHFIFSLIVILLPTQFGRHFWFDFAKISGIRVDYLAPTLYLTDVLIILLALLSASTFFRYKKRKHLSKNNILFLFFLTSLATIHFFYSSSFFESLYGWVKVVELGFLTFFIARTFTLDSYKSFKINLILGSIPVSILGILQFVSQTSIGGPFYFLGERTFSQSTVGIATMQSNFGQILRPYSTFSHPNVFAFYLFFVLIMGLWSIFNEKKLTASFGTLAIFILLTLSLLLTFSRIIILMYMVVLLYSIVKRKIKQKTAIALLLFFVLTILYFFFYHMRFFDPQSVVKDLRSRIDLIIISVQIAKDNLFFGVGLKNFFIHESLLQKNFTEIYLQPVHNIFLLVLVEAGVVGLSLFLYFLFNSLKHLKYIISKTRSLEKRQFYRSVSIVLIAIMFNGLFDHFFLTLQQGQLMFSIVLGIAWSSYDKKRQR